MKKTTYKTILLILIYALALNPVSVVLADQSGGFLSNTATKHCKMDGKAHKHAMKKDDSSSLMKMVDPASSMKMAVKSDCKCKKDCQQGACGQQCAECGHIFVGLPVFNTVLNHTHSTLININLDLRRQQSMLMHYRPPRIFHS